MERKTITKKGIEIIKKWETKRLTVYKDPAGNKTVGYGHLTTLPVGTPITETRAEEMLKEDLRQFENYVNRRYPRLRQSQFDAVVSLVFNIYRHIENTRLDKLLKTDPDSKHVADEWVEFRNSGGQYFRGLLRRRLDELCRYYEW